MARIKLQEQSSYPFSCEQRVRVSDLNYGDHLGYDRLIGLAHESRLEFFASIGVSEMNIGDGVGIVASDLVVVYQGEAHWGHSLSFEICPIDVERVSFRLAQRVKRDSKDPIALVETGFLAFDYNVRRPVRLPAGFRMALLDMNGKSKSEEKS